MRLTLVISLALSFLTSLAVAVESEKTLDVFVWPLTAAKSQSLARVSYNSTAATLVSYTTPKFVSDDETIRVGFYHASGAWSGVATSASNFAADKDRLLRLLLNTEGQLYHVGFLAYDAPTNGKASAGKGAKKVEGMNVQVEKTVNGPVPHMNKPVALKADGTAEEAEPEKSFIQKYWWVLGGFILLQVVIGGKGE